MKTFSFCAVLGLLSCSTVYAYDGRIFSVEGNSVVIHGGALSAIRDGETLYFYRGTSSPLWQAFAGTTPPVIGTGLVVRIMHTQATLRITSGTAEVGLRVSNARPVYVYTGRAELKGLLNLLYEEAKVSAVLDSIGPENTDPREWRFDLAEREFTFNGHTYLLVGWNEVHGPSASTQTERYRNAGSAVFDPTTGKFITFIKGIDLTESREQELPAKSKGGKSKIVFVGTEGWSEHGESWANLHLISFDGKLLTRIKTWLVHNDNRADTNTYLYDVAWSLENGQLVLTPQVNRNFDAPITAVMRIPLDMSVESKGDNKH